VKPSPDQLNSLLVRRQSLLAEQHQRLARRVHDEITQKLTLLALQLSFESTEEESPPEWKQKCRDWSATVNDLCQSARQITDELQPRLLDQVGLMAVLQWYARTHGTDLRFSFTPPCQAIPLPPGIAAELFTICRELLTQLYPRIGASHVDIQAEEADGLFWLHLMGDDNGFGRTSDPERDLDVLSLHERVTRMGGSVQLSTAPGSGTSIVLSFKASVPAVPAPQPGHSPEMVETTN
jgi:signal transduction histidine kinase